MIDFIQSNLAIIAIASVVGFFLFVLRKAEEQDRRERAQQKNAAAK